MTRSTSDTRSVAIRDVRLTPGEAEALLRGEVLTETRSHTAGGAAVTARMYLPLSRLQVWQGVTDYSRWVKYFPALTHSQVIERGTALARRGRQRLYQAAGCAFLCFSARVEVYLTAIETLHRRIQFRFERGTFADFDAELTLDDCEAGTLLTYSVSATPSIPVPSLLLQQGIELAFPENLRQMRRRICDAAQ